MAQWSRDERQGWLLLLAAITLVIIVWLVLPKIIPPKSNPAVIALQQEWKEYQAANIQWQEQPIDESGNRPTPQYDDDALKNIAYAPKAFDPNTASIETMIASGMPISSAKRIIAYRNKNGVFYKKEKLKGFGLDDATYTKIAPYISIAPTPRDNNPSTYNNQGYTRSEYTPKQEPNNLDINTATVEDLKQFRGIGEGYANRIIKNRDRLGGFVNKQQIAETYGLPDSVFRHIEPKIIIDLNTIKKINVNTATEEELAAHPAIGKYMAKNIVLLRNDLKKFEKINDLRQVPMINEEKFRKIVPYIKL